MGSEWQSIADGRAFVAKPSAAGPWPALLVIHAVMGIDAYIKGLAEEWATLGYYAVVPDLYANDSGFKATRARAYRDGSAYGARIRRGIRNS